MGSLPVCVHQMNTGATGSSSEMRAFCMAIWTESTLDVRTTSAPSLKSFSKTISVNDTYQYLGTLSPALTLPNGQPNRSLYWPTEIEVIGYDTVTGQPVIFEFEIYAEALLSGTTWNSVSPVSTVQYDTASTFIASGITVSQRFVNGRDTIDTTTVYDNMQYGAFKNYSEDGGTVIQNITAATNAGTAVLTLGTATRSSLPTLPGRTYFRNGEALTISGVGGMTQLNGNTYYAKPIAANQIELYTDAALTTPVNSSGFGTYTSGGIASGNFGGKFLFTLVAKKLFGTNPAQIYAKIAWKEVVQ
jgi:hypothetical protein